MWCRNTLVMLTFFLELNFGGFLSGDFTVLCMIAIYLLYVMRVYFLVWIIFGI